jgi:hypothetical protein
MTDRLAEILAAHNGANPDRAYVSFVSGPDTYWLICEVERLRDENATYTTTYTTTSWEMTSNLNPVIMVQRRAWERFRAAVALHRPLPGTPLPHFVQLCAECGKDWPCATAATADGLPMATEPVD